MTGKQDVIWIEVGSSDTKSAGSNLSYIVEFSRTKWEAMNEGEREKLLDGFAQEEIEDRFTAWARVIRDGED
jgi:hypothetical protein